MRRSRREEGRTKEGKRDQSIMEREQQVSKARGGQLFFSLSHRESEQASKLVGLKNDGLKQENE